MNTVLSLISTLLLIYLGLGLVLYFGQRAILYYPTPLIDHGYIEEIVTTDVDIRVIVVNPGLEHAVLYFGGNADSMANNAPEMFYSLSEFTVYLVNYRGYGGSGGSPTEDGLTADALILYDEFSKRHSNLHVIGRSLGSGVANHVAANRAIEKLVLVTPYDSIESVAGAHYPIYPAKLMVSDKFDSLTKAVNIDADVLVLMAAHDRVIPGIHSERLISALAHTSISKQILAGTDHNSVSGHADYYPLIREFLNR